MVTHSHAAAAMADKTLLLTKLGIQETTIVNPFEQKTR
jgi:putative ABC transport system ATP-binding protein